MFSPPPLPPFAAEPAAPPVAPDLPPAARPPLDDVWPAELAPPLELLPPLLVDLPPAESPTPPLLAPPLLEPPRFCEPPQAAALVTKRLLAERRVRSLAELRGDTTDASGGTSHALWRRNVCVGRRVDHGSGHGGCAGGVGRSAVAGRWHGHGAAGERGQRGKRAPVRRWSVWPVACSGSAQRVTCGHCPRPRSGPHPR